MMVDELKSELQKAESDSQVIAIPGEKPLTVKEKEGEKENNPNLSVQKLAEKPSPGLILMKLKQAKLNHEKVTLTFEEYSSLRCKAQDAEKICNAKVLEAVLKVEKANLSETDIMKSLEEAMEEVKTSKQALEDALNQVEAANRAKLAVEEALRKWRSENGERRRSLQNSTKFKNLCPSNRRRDSWVLDVNGVSLVSDLKTPMLKPTLSIGQILSQKLLITEEFGSRRSHVKRKVSLGQMLGKQSPVISSAWKAEREFDGPKKTPAKRNKFGFSRSSVLLTKQSKKKEEAYSHCKCAR